MKILFVQKVKAFAGSEKYLSEIIPALNDRGYDCHFFIVIQPEDKNKLANFFETLSEKRIRHTIFETKRDLSFRLLKKLKKSTVKFDPDLIHLNLIHAELWYSLIKVIFRLKYKLVTTIHGFDEDFQAQFGFNPKHLSNSRYVRILKFTERHIGHYFAVSKGLRNLVVEGGIVPATKIRVINYGFDYPIFKAPIITKSVVKTILVPGRLVPYKGQDMVLKVIPDLLKKGHQLEVLVAGDEQGPFGAELKKLSQTLNIENEVKFLGHVSDIETYYMKSDLIVLPSKSEGFGLVLLEAFNFEKPVITFDVPAFNETIIHGKTGIITPAFDLTQLGENIHLLLTDNKKVQELTTAAKERLLAYYSLKRMTDETEAFYGDSIAE